jgi:PAS domain S-box-containing protein
MLESISGGVLTVNREGTVVTFNPAAEIILGASAERIIGKHVSAIFPEIAENEAFYDMINVTTHGHKTFSGKEMVVFTSEKEKVPVRMSTSLLKGKADTLLGVVVNIEDLIKVKIEEERMHTTARLSSLGKLAMGIAHEIRNPLGSIKGLAELIREDLHKDNPKLTYLDIIINEVGRLDTVVEDLLNFAQPGSANIERKIVEINEIIKATTALIVHNASKSQITIETHLGEDLPRVFVDAKKIQQAFLNIVLNACEAMFDKGTLTITSKVSVDKDTLCISFRDTGRGIFRKDLDKIFDPYFTTKEAGAGLGLSIAHQIVAAHQGSIEVASELGKGATFTVRLPLQDL